jgi:ABC-2 type transport system ATP-binding protein
LAQAILHDPDILILDEPTTGLDPNQILEFRELIKRIGASKTVILSTHILQEVEAICDHLMIMNQGKILASGPIGEVSRSLQGDAVYHLRLSGGNKASYLKKTLCPSWASGGTGSSKGRATGNICGPRQPK